jgi:uncharacterized protein YciI
MKYYLYRLIPPRSTFPADMSADEASAMQEHVAYWTDLAKKGTAVAFGPVADPAGAWGVAIIEAGTDEQIQPIAESDPVMKRGLGFRNEVFPMTNVILRDRITS